MAKKLVQNITAREEDFAQWYTDVVREAKLCDYSGVKGCMNYLPNGYALWENIQKELDARFKETGVENVYLPVMIPESLLQKEKDHIEGFAPEVAWVTHGGTEPLQERFCIRPTSETLFCDVWSKTVQSYRDLPKVWNQWCSVLRWEKTTRPFLRSREFLWQEGHTAHSTAQEAEEETKRMLEAYRELCEDTLAMPVLTGRKPEHEKFPGAVDTYCVEAMMQDGKALQAGTSHFLGQNFAKSANISFINKQNQSEYAYTTSWGVSTRLIGGVIMTHADDEGMVVPPRIAPYQVVIIPVIKKPEDEDAIMAYIKEIQKDLAGKTPFGEKIRVKLDKRDRASVDKFWEWTRKGAPVILEIGKRDADGNSVMLKERIKLGTPEGKQILSRSDFEAGIVERLERIQKEMFEAAKARRDANIRTDITTPEAFRAYFEQSNEWIEDGTSGKVAFVRGKWCGDPESEEILKAMKITIRCIPFDQSDSEGICLLTGKPAKMDVIYARSY